MHIIVGDLFSPYMKPLPFGVVCYRQLALRPPEASASPYETYSDKLNFSLIWRPKIEHVITVQQYHNTMNPHYNQSEGVL